VPPNNARVFDLTVRRDDYFHSYGTTELHLPSK